MTATLAAPVSAVERKKSFYRPELDALRFFAFFAVFVFHFSRPVDEYVAHGVPRWIAVPGNALMQGGVFGVDLFFVLSAYLITELLLREKDEYGELDVRSFYLRRILRIWPVYFFMIALALIPAFNPDHTFTWRYAVPFLLLAGNWSIVAYGFPMHSIIGVGWTVSIEEQFYLFWPPIVRKLSRKGIARAGVVMLVIATAMRILMIAVHGGMNSVWCNTVARLDPIAAGILLAIALKGNLPRLNGALRFAMICGGIVPLALIANYWQIHQPVTLEWVPTLLGFPLVALSCTLILVAILGISARLPRFLLYLGKISYGLYIYQVLGNLLSNRVIPVHALFLQLALRPLLALAITILLASASYAFLETPFLKLKKRFTHVKSRPI